MFVLDDRSGPSSSVSDHSNGSGPVCGVSDKEMGAGRGRVVWLVGCSSPPLSATAGEGGLPPSHLFFMIRWVHVHLDPASKGLVGVIGRIWTFGWSQIWG